MPMGSDDVAGLFDDDGAALSVLEAAGWTIMRSGALLSPTDNHKPVGREADAVDYLVDEWDYAWVTREHMRARRDRATE
jgi:hypothetical protein